MEKQICIHPSCIIDMPENMQLGNNIHIGKDTEIQAAGGLKIGNNVVISYHCVLWSIDHNYEGELLPYDHARIRKPIVIEDNVWIGRNSIIRGGVTVGEGAVIAMGSVVVKDVPPLAIVGGNPAKILKFRNPERYNALKKDNKSLWISEGKCGACDPEHFYFVDSKSQQPKINFINKNNELLIHIGYHKTATTWLQQYYFPQHPQIDFIGKHEDLWENLMSPHGFDFDPKIAQEFFYPKIEQALQKNLIPVISAERLSGNPHSGGYDSKEIADHLKKVFPEAKILIMIRHQPEAILSNYKQYIKMGGICTLKEYLFPPQEGRIPLFRLDNLKYHKLANYYAKLFGKENIKIIPYEKFRFHPQAFLEELANFMGIDSKISFPFEEKVNQSLCDATILLKRKVNRWHGNDSLFPVTPPFPNITKKLFDLIQKLDKKPLFRRYNAHFIEQIHNDIGHFYGESNRQLNETFELNLQTYHYCLESI